MSGATERPTWQRRLTPACLALSLGAACGGGPATTPPRVVRSVSGEGAGGFLTAPPMARRPRDLDEAIAAVTAQLARTRPSDDTAMRTDALAARALVALWAPTSDAASVARAAETLGELASRRDPIWGGVYELGSPHHSPHDLSRTAETQARVMQAWVALHRHGAEARALERALELAGFVERFLFDAHGTPLAAVASPPRGAEDLALDDAARREQGLPRLEPASPEHALTVIADLVVALVDLSLALPAEHPARTVSLTRAARLGALLAAHRCGQGELIAPSPSHCGAPTLTDQLAALRTRLSLARVSGAAEPIALARTLLDAIETRYCASSGLCRGAEAAGAPPAPLAEHAALATSLAALADLTNEPSDEVRARAHLLAAARDTELTTLEDTALCDFVRSASLVTHERAVAHVLGPADDPRTDALFVAAQRAADARVQLERATPGQGRYPYPGEPVMFACSLSACAAPVADPEDVAAALRSLL